MWRRLSKIGVGVAIGGVVGVQGYNIATSSSPPAWILAPSRKLPSRDQQLASLQSEKEFDILVIGGGATGTGIALDSVTRGFNTALVEMDDFSSGTSSKSTKLIHGGVRYLEKAFWNLNKGQFDMVIEALQERTHLLQAAPHLTYKLPIMLPVYKYWQLPYFWAGAKAYDLLAGGQRLENSYHLSSTKAVENFPMLNSQNLKGAIVYFDGAQDDARTNVSLALTAALYGAKVANHVKVTSLIKDKSGKAIGANVMDTLSGKKWQIKAKGVISACGPFTDDIRKMDDKSSKEIVAPSDGVHVILPDYYSPTNMGLLDASSSDGRVIFFLPWQGSTIVGTTDRPTKVTESPEPNPQDIDFILNEISKYLHSDVKVRQSDVLAAWSGIRPLVYDPESISKGTQELSRNHIVFTTDSKVIVVAGGKWTTYRRMAQDAVDKAITEFGLPDETCVTKRIHLIGAEAYSETMFIKLIQQFGVHSEVAQHLARSYGDRAYAVANLAKPTNQRWPVVGNRISSAYPFIWAEIEYVSRNEYAETIVDVIARRVRISFLNCTAAKLAIPRIAEIMAFEKSWDEKRKEKEIKEAYKFLDTMGQKNLKSTQTVYSSKNL